jgi:hypothetical protein
VTGDVDRQGCKKHAFVRPHMSSTAMSQRRFPLWKVKRPYAAQEGRSARAALLSLAMRHRRLARFFLGHVEFEPRATFLQFGRSIQVLPTSHVRPALR